MIRFIEIFISLEDSKSFHVSLEAVATSYSNMPFSLIHAWIEVVFPFFDPLFMQQEVKDDYDF